MNNIVQLLTTTEGRIARKHWWLGFGVLVIASIVISMLLALVGLSLWPNMAAVQQGNPEAVSEALATSQSGAAWGALVTFAILAYPAFALGLKRRHDRDNNGLDLKIYYGLTVLLLLMQALGIGYAQQPVPGLEGVTMPMPSPAVAALGLVNGIFGLYMFVVLGCLRGTIGANQYGQDPLGAPVA